MTLHLKPVDQEHGLEDFTDPLVMHRLVKRYSDFVSYPIITKMPHREPELDAAGLRPGAGAHA